MKKSSSQTYTFQKPVHSFDKPYYSEPQKFESDSYSYYPVQPPTWYEDSKKQ